MNGSLKVSRAETGCSCCDGPRASTNLKEVVVVAGDDAEVDVEELAASPEESSEHGNQSIVIRLVVDRQKVVVAPMDSHRRFQAAPENE